MHLEHEFSSCTGNDRQAAPRGEDGNDRHLSFNDRHLSFYPQTMPPAAITMTIAAI